MDIGEPRREIVIEPIEEPRWVEEPVPVEPVSVPQKEPVPA